MFIVEVIVVKRDIECTIWYVALVSIIHSEVLYACLSTMWAEKIECVKEGSDQKGLLEKLLTKLAWAVGKLITEAT